MGHALITVKLGCSSGESEWVKFCRRWRFPGEFTYPDEDTNTGYEDVTAERNGNFNMRKSH